MAVNKHCLQARTLFIRWWCFYSIIACVSCDAKNTWGHACSCTFMQEHSTCSCMFMRCSCMNTCMQVHVHFEFHYLPCIHFGFWYSVAECENTNLTMRNTYGLHQVRFTPTHVSIVLPILAPGWSSRGSTATGSQFHMQTRPTWEKPSRVIQNALHADSMSVMPYQFSTSGIHSGTIQLSLARVSPTRRNTI